MENEPKFEQEGETKIVEGITYRKVFSGYTLRQFYSHETPEKGPGPGWDTRWGILEKYNVRHPSELPDEPYYQWEPVEDRS
ncbi:MAG: hypothetical protein Q7R85_00065 [bacterium]|nr:hypothetical protein [bacterium]